jgi:hypothetical protein
MVQRLPEGYQIDPADPRAPSQEVWDRMSPEERARVVAMLPSEDKPAHLAPEGDVHRKAKNTTAEREELIAKLGAMLDDALVKKQAAEEEAGRIPALQQELAEARAEIERLKRGG